MDNAAAMEKYMKFNFLFLGIKTELRRKILNEVWKKNSDEVREKARTIALTLFDEVEREFHLSAVEILIKQTKGKYRREDKKLIEQLILKNSWWDTVDFLAKYLLGNYLLEFPEEREQLIRQFSDASSIWLNRSAILFQLSYKEKTDEKLLFQLCSKHSRSKEFFIQKAIGWALREYAKINAEAVLAFVCKTELPALSKREALKHFKNK